MTCLCNKCGSYTKKLCAFYWDMKQKKIERIEEQSGTSFEKAHKEFLRKLSVMARKPRNKGH